MLGIYRMVFDCGRDGELESIFIASELAVAAAIGKIVYFGEALGKHSEVSGPLGEEEIALVTANPMYVALTLREFGGYTLCGPNPLEYIEGADEEDHGISPSAFQAIISACSNFEAKYGKSLAEFSAEFGNADATAITVEMAVDWIEWTRSLSLRNFYFSRFESWREEDDGYQEKYGKTFPEFSLDFNLMENHSSQEKEDYYNWRSATADLLLFKDFMSQP